MPPARKASTAASAAFASGTRTIGTIASRLIQCSISAWRTLGIVAQFHNDSRCESAFELFCELEIQLHDFSSVENAQRLFLAGETIGLRAKLVIDIAAQIVKVVTAVVLGDV